MSCSRNPSKNSCDCLRATSSVRSATHPSSPISLRTTKMRLVFSALIGLFAHGVLAVEVEPLSDSTEPALPVAGALAATDAELFAVDKITVTEPAEEGAQPVVITNGVADPTQEWHTVTRIKVKTTYDTNVFISSENEVADVYVSAIPELTVGWGDFRREFTSMMGVPSRFRKAPEGSDARNYLFATYAPEAVVFFENSGENTINQDLAIRGAYQTGRWTFGVLGRAQSLSDPDIEVGTRTDRVVLTLELNVGYWISDKTSLDGKFSARREDYQFGVDSTDFLTQIYADYRVGAKTTMGIGFGLGYLETAASSNQIYEQLLVRGSYLWSQKLRLDLTTGVEFRQTVDGRSSKVDPLVMLSAVWDISDTTSLTFSASRALDSSAVIAGETIEYTTVGARLRQELWQRVYVSFEGGFTDANYDRPTPQGATAREDSFFFLGLAVAAEINQHLSAQASYRYQNNDSSQESNGFERSLAEFQLGYQF